MPGWYPAPVSANRSRAAACSPRSSSTGRPVSRTWRRRCLQAAVGVLGGLLGRLVDGVVAGAVGAAREGDVADVRAVAGQVPEPGQPLPARAALGVLGVEAVVVVAAAPADREDDLARVLRVDGDVIGDVLVRGVRVGGLRAAGQVVRVGRELQLPGPLRFFVEWLHTPRVVAAHTLSPAKRSAWIDVDSSSSPPTRSRWEKRPCRGSART